MFQWRKSAHPEFRILEENKRENMYRIPSTAGYFPADALFLDIFLGGSPEGKVVHPTTEEDLTDG